MARILIDLTDEQLQALATIMEMENRPRTAIIREAVAAYIVDRSPALASDTFGLWKRRAEDGQAYQERMREEW